MPFTKDNAKDVDVSVGTLGATVEDALVTIEASLTALENDTAKLTKSGDTITGEILNTSTGAFEIAEGTTAQRPTGDNGKLRYNTDLGQVEAYDETTSDWLKVVSPNVETNLASAATTDLGSVVSDNIRITGTATITSFGTARAGVRKNVRVASTPTFSYNPTSMILPGATSIVATAGDSFEALSLGGGNWVVTGYQRVAGGLGVGQTWQNLTASRAATTLYTNNTGVPIMVNITVSGTITTGTMQADLVVGGITVAGTFDVLGINTHRDTLSAIVPNGVTYSLQNLSQASITMWAELRS